MIFFHFSCSAGSIWAICGVGLLAGPLVVGVVGDEAAEGPGRPRGELADGDVDVERRLLDADQVVAGHAADRHEDAEDEQHLARGERAAERHAGGVDVGGDQGQDRQVEVRRGSTSWSRRAARP